MEQFSFNFISTMMHSIWQSALLLLVYVSIVSINIKPSPLFKRNLLYSLTGTQFILSFFTFIIIASQPSMSFMEELSTSLIQSIQGSWLQNNAVILFGIYTVVVLIRLGNSFFPWNQFKSNYTKSLIKPSLDIRLFTQTKAYHFGIAKKVAIWCSNTISTPMTFGFFKPVILLPVALVNRLSMQETEALIIHELTHIRQHDYLFNWLLVIGETLYFFNPFLHIIAQKIKTEREKNCDVQVLQFNYGKVLYAETLLKTAQYQQQQLSLQIAAVKNNKQLLQRIHFFSDSKNLNFKRNSRFISTLGYMSVLLINVLLAGIFFQKEKNQPVAVNAIHDVIKMNAVSKELNKNITTTAVNPGKKTASTDRVEYIVKTVSQKAISNKKQLNSLPVLSIEDERNYYTIPVSKTETILEGKEIIIKEESSEGTKTTAAYNALLINGVWTLQPLWMMRETKPSLSDSLKTSSKDSVIKIFNVVQ
ncbi:MAG TPA: M56 family metallopeptidase [Ferruginibacter sp.]|nr:M56 family metallopeptidase [Ferruginibacter sp.]